MNGHLRYDPGGDYVLEDNGVKLIGKPIESQGSLTLLRINHPWQLSETYYLREPDGWIGSDGGYVYFGPAKRGTLVVEVSRAGFCNASVRPTPVTVRVGPPALNEQRAAVVARDIRAPRARAQLPGRTARVQRASPGRRARARRRARATLGLRRDRVTRARRAVQRLVQAEALTSSGNRTRVNMREPGSGSKRKSRDCTPRGRRARCGIRNGRRSIRCQPVARRSATIPSAG